MLSAWTSTPCSIHDLQALRAEDVAAATASHLGERRACDDIRHRNDAVRVHINHSDPAPANRHLAPLWLSLKRGARRAMADHTGARRTAHQRPEEVSAIAHPAFLASCLPLHERLQPSLERIAKCRRGGLQPARAG